MTFVSAHRPLHAYTDAINDAGLLIERLREPAAPEHAITRPRSRRWQRLPSSCTCARSSQSTGMSQGVKRLSSRVPGAPLQGRITVVRPATGADVDLLVRWHAHPEVARYWGGKTYSREQIVARLARPQVDAYIVEADGEPVGYLQAWFGRNGGRDRPRHVLDPQQPAVEG